MRTSIEERLLACENENTSLRRLVRRQNYLWIGVLLLATGAAVATANMGEASFGTIRASEVAIVDGKGVIRARLGGDLPNAVSADGRVLNRGSKAAGLIIYDEEGLERGGYVTQDTGSNAMLTLDSKSKQAVLLVAAPEEEQSSALKLWTRDSAIELRSDSDGSRISAMVGQAVVFQKPDIAILPPATCEFLKDLEQQYPKERICRSRFTESTCVACMDIK